MLATITPGKHVSTKNNQKINNIPKFEGGDFSLPYTANAHSKKP